MKYAIPQNITEISRMLRQKMTPAEKILWQSLRSKKIWIKFLRQHPLYVFTEDTWQHRFVISDFYCNDHNLIIELDWWIHDVFEVEGLDKYKEELLTKQWYNIIRFKNKEIFEDIEWVIKNINSNL